MVVSLICTDETGTSSYQSSLPVWLEVLDGNRADKESFPKTIQAYIAQMQESASTYFIADSALYSADNIKSLSQVKWITRVPATLNEVKRLYQTTMPEQMQESSKPGLSYIVDRPGSSFTNMGNEIM